MCGGGMGGGFSGGLGGGTGGMQKTYANTPPPIQFNRYGPNQHQPFRGTPNTQNTPMVNGLPNFLVGAPPGVDMQMGNNQFRPPGFSVNGPSIFERPPDMPAPPPGGGDVPYRPPEDVFQGRVPTLRQGPSIFERPPDLPAPPPGGAQLMSKPFYQNTPQPQNQNAGPPPNILAAVQPGYEAYQDNGVWRQRQKSVLDPVTGQNVHQVGGIPVSQLMPRGGGMFGFNPGAMQNQINGNPFGIDQEKGGVGFNNWNQAFGDIVRRLQFGG